MLPVRCAVAAGLVLAATLPVKVATAAPPKTVCRAIVDPADDEGYDDVHVASPSVDLRTADVSADSSQLSVAIRPAKLEMPPIPFNWIVYLARFQVGEYQYEVAATREASRQQFTLWAFSAQSGNAATVTKIGPIKGLFDAARGEVRMTVPASMLDVGLRRGQRVTVVSMEIAAGFGVDDDQGLALGPADGHPEDHSYRIGTPTCVKPVR